MMKNATATGAHLFSISKTSKLIGIANPNAVKNESWRGEMFFIENMLRRYKEEGTRHKEQVSACYLWNGLCLVPCTWCLHHDSCFSKLKFIPYSFYGSNTVYSQLLPDLTNMNV